MQIIQFNTVLKQLSGYAVFLIVFSMLLQSCADLDPNIEEFTEIPGKYEDIIDAQEGITGVYNQLYSATNFNDAYAPSWGGDDITTNFGANKEDFRQFDQRNVESTNARLNNNWRNSLNIINNANIVIDRANDLVGNDTVDQLILERIIGEAYFLRGMIFQHLARIHGRIILPITVDPIIYSSLSSQIEVYEQIESDFLEAESRLPDTNPDSVTGATRPNKGSARALLARLYMDWAGFPERDTSKYTDAQQKASQVINNKGAHGFELVSDFGDLWKVENRFNTEGVYTIPYCNACGLGNFKYGILGLPGDLSGWQECLAEIKFFEDFPAGPRKEATYRTDLEWESFNDQKNPVFAKITGPIGDLAPRAFLTDRSDFWIRYAEVLLIYAESSGRSGNVTPEAWEALNMIRRRAEGLPFATPDPSVDLTTGDIAELAVTERKWEFAGEFLRWYDLVRLERIEQALGDRQPQVSIDPATGSIIDERNPILGSLGTDNYFAPIPQAAIDDNPDLGN